MRLLVLSVATTVALALASVPAGAAEDRDPRPRPPTSVGRTSFPSSVDRTDLPTSVDGTDLPTSVDGGAWDTSHLQGVVVDRERDQILWSFTTVLVRTDLDGELLGTATGLTGHLGDLAQDPRDGRVYGSLEYKAEEAFYVAVFDPEKIDRVGLDAATDDVMKVVYLPDVVDDFTADLDGDGVFDGDTADTADHRYGSSGIDGVAFGPAFDTRHGSRLTVAYGIYENLDRTDNDSQVLLQLDTRFTGAYERQLVPEAPERVGPSAKKYFVRTGNTRFGIQNLEHDPTTGDWLAAVYPGSKPQYPNYGLFVIDGRAKPFPAQVNGTREIGPHLRLAKVGERDRATGIRGYRFDASYGLQSMGRGYVYRGVGRPVEPGETGRSAGRIELHRWTRDGLVRVD